METADYNPFPPEAHEFVDGRLSAEAERDFVRRLERDPALKQQVDELRKAISLLRETPITEPKPGFAERVLGRIRDEDLADRARKRIVAAPTPLWQHIVQVGLGAAAAALVFAIVGMPGLFSDETDPLHGGGEMSPMADVSPTAEDLLPALADHNARFESLRRNVAHTKVADPRIQRQVVAMELECSDLARRNQWLSAQAAEMPARDRARYAEFLSGLEHALAAISEELNESHKQDRVLNIGLVNAELAKVRTPGGSLEKYRFNADSSALDGSRTVGRMGSSGESEVSLYAAVRLADYRHDHLAVLAAAESYLQGFPLGLFSDHAKAAIVAAHLRRGADLEAGRQFKARFAEYDEDLKPGQLDVVRGLLTHPEAERLAAARKALRE